MLKFQLLIKRNEIQIKTAAFLKIFFDNVKLTEIKLLEKSYWKETKILICKQIYLKSNQLVYHL